MQCAQFREREGPKICSICLLTNYVGSGIMENSARHNRQRAAEFLSILFSFVQNDENPQPKK